MNGYATKENINIPFYYEFVLHKVFPKLKSFSKTIKIMGIPMYSVILGTLLTIKIQITHLYLI